MAFTWADVLLIDAALASVPAAVRARILVEVDLRVPASRWGNKRDLARGYLAAHLGIMWGRTGDAGIGQILSDSIGGVSTTYAQVMTDSHWDATPWGAAYRQLVRELVPARLPFVV